MKTDGGKRDVGREDERRGGKGRGEEKKVGKEKGRSGDKRTREEKEKELRRKGT